jgi:hypothetical protein
MVINNILFEIEITPTEQATVFCRPGVDPGGESAVVYRSGDERALMLEKPLPI